MIYLQSSSATYSQPHTLSLIHSASYINKSSLSSESRGTEFHSHKAARCIMMSAGHAKALSKRKRLLNRFPKLGQPLLPTFLSGPVASTSQSGAPLDAPQPVLELDSGSSRAVELLSKSESNLSPDLGLCEKCKSIIKAYNFLEGEGDLCDTYHFLYETHVLLEDTAEAGCSLCLAFYGQMLQSERITLRELYQYLQSSPSQSTNVLVSVYSFNRWRQDVGTFRLRHHTVNLNELPIRRPYATPRCDDIIPQIDISFCSENGA